MSFHQAKSVWSVILACLLLFSGVVPAIPFTEDGVTTNVAQASSGGAGASLEVGDCVVFGSYTTRGPIVWKVINVDGTGTPMLFAEQSIGNKPFDMKGSFHLAANGGPTARSNNGSNYYPNSNIRQWLNSAQSNAGSDLIDWIQNDPWTQYDYGTNYSTEKGFLANGNFTATERAMIKPLTHNVIIGTIDSWRADGGSEGHIYTQFLNVNFMQNYDSAYYQTVIDNVFLLSLKQLKEYVIDRGWHPGISTTASTRTPYYLNTPATLSNTSHPLYVMNEGASVRVVDQWGTSIVDFYASSIHVGIRPALQLNPTVTSISGGTGTCTNPHTVAFVDSPPTDISLSSQTVSDTLAVGAKAADISSSGDPKVGDSATYSFAVGQGDTDNSLFTISNNALYLQEPLDASVKNGLTIRLKATDGGGLSFEKAISITVNSERPTNISLSNTTIFGNAGHGATVGQLSASDLTTEDSFSYALVQGAGDTDNQSFRISGSSLLLHDTPNISGKSSYSVRVRVTDGTNASFEKTFVLSVSSLDIYIKASVGQQSISAAGTAIDSGLVIPTNVSPITSSSSINGATVLISSNFDAGKDSLSYTGSLPSGVTVTSFNTTTGLLRFNGSTTPANWQTLLRTVRFTTNSTNNAPRTIRYTLGAALPLQLPNGQTNYYEVVNSKQRWNNARPAAENRQTAGVLNGYLATLQTTAEDAFLKNMFNVSGWLGGSDEFATVNSSLGNNTTTGFANQPAAEGRFHWVTGPSAERGLFSNGNSPDVETVTGFVTSWADGEPNNSGGEHFVLFGTSGWNDARENITSTYTYGCGWLNLSTCTGTNNNNPDNYYVEYSGSAKSLTASVALYRYHTVTFDTADGNTIAAVQQPSSLALPMPTNPTKAGFGFAGWFMDSALTTPYDFRAAVTSNLTLYAKWVAYTVTFDSNGGSAVASQSVALGSTASEPTPPTKNNHSFVGWYTDVALTKPFAFNIAVKSDITLYAKWIAYTVTFNSNGGSAVASQSQPPNATVTEPSAPTRSGYGFGGWFSDSALTQAYSFATPVTGDVTLYAKWLQYTASFVSNGGGSVPSVTFAPGETISEPAALTRAGYLFAGWFTNSGLTDGFDFSTAPSGNITLYGKWNVDPQPPSNVFISKNEIARNSSIGSLVGTLSATDINENDTFTFSLISGDGDEDNHFFTIQNGEVRTATAFDSRTETSYSLRIRVTDSAGFTFVKIITVYVFSELQIGQYVKFGTYYSAPIVWRVVGKDSAGNPMLLSDRILSLKPFDASGSYHSPDNARSFSGSSYYLDSNIRQWLNSSQSNSGANTIDWIQNNPIFSGTPLLNYASEKGFLADGNFTATERAMIKPYTYQSEIHTKDQAKKDGGTGFFPSAWVNSAWTQASTLSTSQTGFYKTVTDSVIVPTIPQLVEFVGKNSTVGGASYIPAKPTTELVCIAKSDMNAQYYMNLNNFSTTNNWDYWSQTPSNYPEGIGLMSIYRQQGSNNYLNSAGASNGGYIGVRPMMQLDKQKMSFVLNGTGTEQNPFVMYRGSGGDGSGYFLPAPTICGLQQDSSKLTATSATLQWSLLGEDTNVDAYEIYRNGVLIGTVSGSDGNPPAQSFQVTGLAPLTLHKFTVKAKMKDNSVSEATSELSVFTPASQTNTTPSEITVSTNTVNENSAIGSTVATLTTNDTDADETFTYTLVSGDGDADNNSFTIDGNALKVNAAFDFETKSSYTARVRVTDSKGATFEKVISISINDVDEIIPTAPTALGDSQKTETTVKLTWGAGSDNSGNVSYEIFNNGSLIATTTETSYTATNLIPEEENNFTVVTVDGTGNKSAPSNAILVITYDTEAPSVPTGLVASQITTNSFVLSWNPSTDNVGVAGYNVFINGNFLGSITGTQYTVTGRAHTTTFSMTVQAFDAEKRLSSRNRSARSAPLAVKTLTPPDVLPPTTPQNVTATFIYANKALFTWTPSTDNVGVTGYNVYQNGVYIKTVPTASTELTGLTQLTSYTLTVLAVDAARNRSLLTTPLTFTTTDGSAPTVPTGVAASNITKRGFTVSWNASTDNVGVDGYHIYRNGSYVNTLKNGVRSFNFSNLPFNETHQIRIEAFDLAGNRSARSTAVPIATTFTPDPIAPSAPTNVVSSNISGSGFSISWTAATDNVGVTAYNLYRGGTYVATVNAPLTRYNFSGLTPSTTYSIVVRALDAEQNFTNSTALSVTTTANLADTVKPTAPTNVVSSSVTTTGFRINWTAATDNVGVTGYNIYRNGSYLATVSGTTTTYTFSGLTASTTYSVYVRALDAAKNFENSTTISVTTLAAGDTTAPTAPTNVTSSNLSKTGFRISWTAATDNVAVANYNIYRNGAYLATVSGTTTSYNFSGLTAGTTYSVYVRSLDAAKNFTNSTTISVTTFP